MTIATTDRISENVHTMTYRNGISRAELCRRSGIPTGTLSQRMTGKYSWSADDLDRIAPVLGVTVAELVADLPSLEAWEARKSKYTPRDSNPEPAVSTQRRRSDYALGA